MNELIELANRLRREANARDADPDDFDADLTADMRQAAAALEAASSPAPGEPVAWIVQLLYDKERDRWSGEMLTDHLPENDGTYRVIRPLYASPPTSPPEPPTAPSPSGGAE